MTKVTVEQAVDWLGEIGRITSEPHLSEALGDVADVLEMQVVDGFAAEETPDHTPWQSWYFRDPQYAATKGTLYSSGRLEESTRRDGRDHIEEITENTLTYGTGVPYAAIHQEGAQIVTGRALVGRHGEYLPAGSTLNIPQREFLGFSEETLASAVDIIGNHMIDQIGALS